VFLIEERKVRQKGLDIPTIGKGGWEKERQATTTQADNQQLNRQTHRGR
jgi:hypothetical protein